MRVCSVEAARSLFGFATPSNLFEVFEFLVDDAILVMSPTVISVSTFLDKYAIELRLRQFAVLE
ncbi:MAG: hypothetical protein AUI05_01090 [Verrucomicrobia bacterium 13_2_20CM_2_54_15_9cls]|nr:MAG: hypothetical protein AUI05_01090 [Verrucomicrobia bacterium 13_2_20CM_2_54_15_9cls]